MKITFELPKDGKRHRYCQNCFSEKISDITIDEKLFYHCDNCGQDHDRMIDLNPERKWWIDEKQKS